MIVGMLRVKNESRWIARVIQSLRPVTEKIFILDDHSSDGTPEICEELGCVVFRSEFEGLHEARDKDFLLEQLWEHGLQLGDWCLMFDGDELLRQEDIPTLMGLLDRPEHAFTFPIIYLWDQEDTVRVDRWYSTFSRPSMFRAIARHMTFTRTEYGGSLHCSSVPTQVIGGNVKVPVRILHLGYLHREDRIRKYKFYNTVDPGNTFEGFYRHVVVGDLPEIPATSVERWAGPLELVPISACKILH